MGWYFGLQNAARAVCPRGRPRPPSRANLLKALGYGLISNFIKLGFSRVSKGILPFGRRGFSRRGIEPLLGRLFSSVSVRTEKDKPTQISANQNQVIFYIYGATHLSYLFEKRYPKTLISAYCIAQSKIFTRTRLFAMRLLNFHSSTLLCLLHFRLPSWMKTHPQRWPDLYS